MSLLAGGALLGATGACGEKVVTAARLGEDGVGGAKNDSLGGGSGELPEDVINYRLVWSDEFEGTGLPDAENWNYDTLDATNTGPQLQAYTGARTENLRVEDGYLIIEARRDNFDGNEYTSGSLNTSNKAAWNYGRVEVRAKLPEGRGTWPAIWMRPQDPFKYATTCDAESGWIEGCDAWPNSGEIDLLEHVGHDPGVIHGSVHCKTYNFQIEAKQTKSTVVEYPFDNFHIFEMVWNAQEVRWLADGAEFFRYENARQGWEAWPFDQPFYLVLNLAIGGDWGGAEGVDPDAFPTQMQVDYIRVYEQVEP